MSYDLGYCCLCGRNRVPYRGLRGDENPDEDVETSLATIKVSLICRAQHVASDGAFNSNRRQSHGHSGFSL